jgi:hypothetical protein
MMDVRLIGDEAEKKGRDKDARTLTWESFLNGHWERTRPIRPGRFRIATLDGLLVGEIVVMRDPANHDRLVISQEWDGWFWSFPTPMPPMPVPGPQAGDVKPLSSSAPKLWLVGSGECGEGMN